ncbi:unnamed protein product [Didymodactylos carnosus]|uniref:oleoyl-[acyl-carrier-protein] hydrolase n=1 Tax=Didymodactylos carnosus TaxID=1234261 RepID=A0A8S2EB78_9BILA|nr:unnamed protein product [Didymodactylos carnosus]CAF3989921.1 unnamed protein product [Didymodactylos carnosus]
MVAFLYTLLGFLFELDVIYELSLLPPLFTFELIENLFKNQTTYCSPIIFAYKWSVIKSREDQLPARITELATKKYVYVETPRMSSEILNVETIINKIRATTASIFGSVTVDRIDVDKSLVQQGMDSLMGVALYNWIEKELNINIPLSEVLQGATLTKLGHYIHGKLNERLLNSSSSKTKESTDIDETVERVEDTNRSPSATTDKNQQYTSISLIASVYQSSMENRNKPNPIFFYLNDISTPISIFEQFTTKMKDHSTAIYAFHSIEETNDAMMNNKLTTIEKIAEEYLAQMRRIQPRGPYCLIGYKLY